MLDQGTSAVIVSIVSAIGAYAITKRADRAAKKKPPPAPRATKADVEEVEAKTNRRMEALETVVEDLLGRLSAKTEENEQTKGRYLTLRDLFVYFVNAVNRSWGTSDTPPQLTPEQRSMLYDEPPATGESPAFNTQATRRALREHSLVTLIDNPPPSTPEPRRRRH